MRITALPMALLLLLLAAPLPAQLGGRDALTAAETDELREVAQEPEKRLKLLLKYLRTRMQSVDQLRADSKPIANRGKQMHDLLEDFGKILDELDDNIDDYADHRADLRKPLRDIIDAENDFQAKLRAISQAASTAGSQSQDYAFVLQNDLDAVGSSLEDAQKLLDQQEIDFKAAKEAEKQKSKKR